MKKGSHEKDLPTWRGAPDINGPVDGAVAGCSKLGITVNTTGIDSSPVNARQTFQARKWLLVFEGEEENVT